MDKELMKKSKAISYLLRHNPEPLLMSKQGWVDVDDLLDYLDLELCELEEIVKSNNKKRFSFDEDGFKIRANQGHSLDWVDVELEKVRPLFPLYHGTAVKNKEIILKSGIKKMNRQHVHLSQDTETAKNVGGRHGKPIIFEVDVRHMYADGIIFYLSENNVWLTDFIDPKYLTLLG